MGEKRAYKARKPGGGRKKLKPEYDAGKNLKEQMESAVAFYDSEMSLQAIADELGLKVETVRNYFGGDNYDDGKAVGLHYEKGPEGGIVQIDDTTILEKAKEMLAN